MSAGCPWSGRRLLALLALCLCLGRGAAEEPAARIDEAALRRASDAVVGIRSMAVEDARSNASLGRLREGSGIVVGEQGLVLTIGYLVLEADQVQLLLDDGRSLPARVVGVDIATGFALLRSLVPLSIAAAPFGHLPERVAAEPMIVISGGEEPAVTATRVADRRPFAGYWEYRIDEALFTVPARPAHSGAGLFNLRGELLGVGSLLLADAHAGQPGNMFVPVSLLEPILQELQATGTTHSSQRAWIGVNCEEAADGVRVLRVNEDSPSARAGVQPGDRVVSLDGHAVSTLADLWTHLWGGGPAERRVALTVRRDGSEKVLQLDTENRMKTLRRATGT